MGKTILIIKNTLYYLDFELAAKTRFVGVIAHYADINNSYWADIVDVDAIGKKETLIIHIKTNEILIKKENK